MKTKCIICETIIKTKSNKRVTCGGDCSIIYERVSKLLVNRFNRRKTKQVEELKSKIKYQYTIKENIKLIDKIFKDKKESSPHPSKKNE